MIAQPPAVLMENVPDMALDKEMFILRTMVHELESLGYAVEERVVDTSQYGVPQFRQRLILVALATTDRVHLAVAHGRTRSRCGTRSATFLRWKAGGGQKAARTVGLPMTAAPTNAFQQRMREGMDGDDTGRVLRPHHSAGT